MFPTVCGWCPPLPRSRLPANTSHSYKSSNPQKLLGNCSASTTIDTRQLFGWFSSYVRASFGLLPIQKDKARLLHIWNTAPCRNKKRLKPHKRKAVTPPVSEDFRTWLKKQRNRRIGGFAVPYPCVSSLITIYFNRNLASGEPLPHQWQLPADERRRCSLAASELHAAAEHHHGSMSESAH